MVRSVCEGQVQVDLLGRTLPPVNPHSHNTLTDGHGRASPDFSYQKSGIGLWGLLSLCESTT